MSVSNKFFPQGEPSLVTHQTRFTTRKFFLFYVNRASTFHFLYFVFAEFHFLYLILYSLCFFFFPTYSLCSLLFPLFFLFYFFFSLFVGPCTIVEGNNRNSTNRKREFQTPFYQIQSGFEDTTKNPIVNN